ncbi:MAG: hypothetical protein H8E91_02335 [Planctomycetes bacterium]|nr:hypothetical protein [Planctomycetota bacterium]
MKFVFSIVALVFVVSATTGCASTSQGPSVLVISQAQYAAAFDAAASVAAADGMKPAVLDRRGGVIHTDPAAAGSIVEPWKPIASSPRQALENTMTLQRRTARFEFRPVVVEELPNTDVGELAGPALLTGSGVDLTTYDGSIEVRVWVYVDRQYKRGIRRGTWSLSSETVTKELPADSLWEQTPSTFWVPMTRDVARERALLAGVETQLSAQ